ncbi:MAG: hypothetical protein E4H14_02825 [Candidatus Thorarchaeota archaeon]|nr:MAG: hypothetical protein E4H14_02825 [Candidatus Thorarchaeota archaeon]
MKRAGRLLIFLGIAAILLSSLGSYTYFKMDYRIIEENDPFVYLFEIGQDVHVNVTLDDHSIGTFNVYFMTWQDANKTMVENMTATPITPISSFENISSLQENLNIPAPGIYALLFTTESTELQIIWVELSASGLQTRVTSGGVLLAGVGAVMLVLSVIQEHRTKNSLGEKAK